MTDSRAVAWAAFVLGAVASIAANVAHAAERAAEAGVGGMIAASWAPVALLLVAEMVTRGRRGGPWWIAGARWAGTIMVAGVAAVVSYGHMRALLLSYGETALVATLLPLSVDGLVLVASVALAAPVTAPEPAAAAEPVPAPVPLVRWPVVAPVGVRVLPMVACSVSARAVSVKGRDGIPSRCRAEPAAVEVSALGVQAAAREWARTAERDGRKVTGKEVGDRFGRTDRWGRDRLREARAELQPTLV